MEPYHYLALSAKMLLEEVLKEREKFNNHTGLTLTEVSRLTTVHINCGRNIGHTKAIEYILETQMFKNPLVLFANQATAVRFGKKHTSGKFTTSSIMDCRSFRGTLPDFFDVVIVDGASVLSQDTISRMYEETSVYCPRYIFFG